MTDSAERPRRSPTGRAAPGGQGKGKGIRHRALDLEVGNLGDEVASREDEYTPTPIERAAYGQVHKDAQASCVIGLDLSLTSTGLVMLGSDSAVMLAMEVKTRATAAERLMFIRDSVMEAIDDAAHGIFPHDPTVLAVIEGYAYGAPYAGPAVGELGGVIRVALWEAGIRYVVVPPLRLKQFVTGQGKGGKEAIIKDVFKRWGYEHPSNDVVDAYGLARMGLGLMGWDDKLTQQQREILAKVEGKE